MSYFLKLTGTILTCLLLVSSVSGNSRPAMTNLTGLINSTGDDFSPTATTSGRFVIFNSKRENTGGHDLFMVKNTQGFWSKPLPLKELNTKYNEETPYITGDGRVLLFASDRPGAVSPVKTSKGNKLITYNIYISYNVKGLWSVPEPIKGEVNTTWNERSPSLSHDGTTLFFTRWPYKNFSRARLCMATLKNGRYTDVQEIGPPVHEKSLEIAMIPAIEKNKYYFSSIRDGGNGGWDIYYTYFIDGKFSKPVILGKEINTEHDELYYVPTLKYSLLASNRPDSMGGFDIYTNRSVPAGEKNIVKSVRMQNKETRLKITSIESETGDTIKNSLFKIILFTLNGDKRVTERTSDDDGSVTVRPKADVIKIEIVPDTAAGNLRSVSVDVIHGNYQELVLKFKPSEKKEPKGKENITEKPEKHDDTSVKKDANTVHKTVDSRNLNEHKYIYFSFNSWKIKTVYYPLLHSIADSLRSNPQLKLLITGHAGTIGSGNMNQHISLKRAMEVHNYIKCLGISGNQMHVTAMGEKNPRVWAKSIKGNITNRRVELIITEK